MNASSVLIGIGSNLGNSVELVEQSIESLANSSVSVVRTSSFVSSMAVGGPSGQPDFVNAVVFVKTELCAEELAARLRQVEQQIGRERELHWGPRLIDLDLLIFEDQVLSEPKLTIPHPRMAFRPFVLAPAAQIASDMVHPELGTTCGELWSHLQKSMRWVWIEPSTDPEPLIPLCLALGAKDEHLPRWHFGSRAPSGGSSTARPRLALRVSSVTSASIAPLSHPEFGPLPTLEFLTGEGSESPVVDLVALIHGTQTTIKLL